MSNVLDEFNRSQIDLLSKNIPDFRSGDTLKVSIRIVDGVNERVQVFEGVCIKIRNRSLHSSFTLRKVSHGESVELQIFFYSPLLQSVEVVRFGKVRRAKLYYMRKLFGKAARIKERTTNLSKEAKTSKK